MNPSLISVLSLTIALAAACASNEGATELPGPVPSDDEPGSPDPGAPDDAPEPGDEPVDEPNPDPTAACSGAASYRVSMSMTWDPSDVPNPHWSPLVGAVHRASAGLWELGATASPGIEVMAETGSTGPLVAEVAELVASGDALASVVGPPIALSPGAATVDVELSPSHSQVTLVSMLAPSPDWFVGVSGVELCRDGEWVEGFVDLEVYDAGTDSGIGFTSANADTVPAQPIALEPGFAPGGVPRLLGRMTFELL